MRRISCVGLKTFHEWWLRIRLLDRASYQSLRLLETRKNLMIRAWPPTALNYDCLCSNLKGARKWGFHFLQFLQIPIVCFIFTFFNILSRKNLAPYFVRCLVPKSIAMIYLPAGRFSGKNQQKHGCPAYGPFRTREPAKALTRRLRACHLQILIDR